MPRSRRWRLIALLSNADALELGHASHQTERLGARFRCTSVDSALRVGRCAGPLIGSLPLSCSRSCRSCSIADLQAHASRCPEFVRNEQNRVLTGQTGDIWGTFRGRLGDKLAWSYWTRRGHLGDKLSPDCPACERIELAVTGMLTGPLHALSHG